VNSGWQDDFGVTELTHSLILAAGVALEHGDKGPSDAIRMVQSGILEGFWVSNVKTTW
jgi:hypothetical protein